MSAESATFELWDLDSRNVLGVYPSSNAALALVRETVDECGAGSVARWELLRVPDG